MHTSSVNRPRALYAIEHKRHSDSDEPSANVGASGGVVDVENVNDTELRFKRSMRDAFPFDYTTSAVETPEPPRTKPVREALEIVALTFTILGLFAWAWWPR